jgi:hypothetical protein
MSKAATPNRWFSGWRSGAQPVEMDAADLGTAFGLDLSLNEMVHEPPVTVAPAFRRPGWMSRLTPRRKPSD